MPANFRQLLADAIQHFRKGQLPDAERLFREVLAVRPRDTDAMLHLALLCGNDKKYEEAVDLLTRLIAIKPYSREAIGSLGAMYEGLGRHREAIDAFQQVLTLNPNDAPTLYNLGISYKSNGQLAEAVDAYRRALALKPDYVDALFNLGNALDAQKKPEEAIDAFQQALRLKPQHAESENNLGHALKALGRLDEAIDHYRRAMTIKPVFTDAIGALADALRDIGQVEESVRLSEFMVAKNPDDAALHSTLLFTRHYLATSASHNLRDEHIAWAKRYTQTSSAADLAAPFADHDRSPDRRLRVGYVSSDFRAHSVAFFLENLLAFHDPAQVEIFCYSDVTVPDRITTRFKTYAHHWRDTKPLSADALASLIREDKIDILLDLAGHTANTRLATFAMKPAPIQISYLGYTHTSGVEAIDYRLADAYTDPPGMTEPLHTETLVRLPKTFACYRPPDDAPDVAPLPALTTGKVTFGCFGTLPKLNTPLLETYAGVLQKSPCSRLLLVAGGFDSQRARERILRIFTDRGIDPQRIELLGYQKPQPYLALHHRIDILLDTFPIGGHTITCNALWMGVPTITQTGWNYVSRLSTSVLMNLQLPELIAATAEEFVEIAVKLSHDIPRITVLRETMRARMLASPLMDYPAFAADVEAAYRTLWQHWCNATTP